jgi:hypothetical protein
VPVAYALEDGGVGDTEHVVRREALRLLEPPRGHAVEDLALVRDGAEHAVERADAIGDDDVATPVTGRVVVADLAFVLRPEGGEVRVIEAAREGGA